MPTAGGGPPTSSAPPGNGREVRACREARARRSCSVLGPCRSWARDQGEYGFWGGESEEEPAAMGYGAPVSVRLIARYLRATPIVDVPRRWSGTPPR